jgi:hypothetical protein
MASGQFDISSVEEPPPPVYAGTIGPQVNYEFNATMTLGSNIDPGSPAASQMANFNSAMISSFLPLPGAGPANAAETAPMLLNQFNSADSLILNAGTLTTLKGGSLMGTVTGDGDAIFNAISQGGQTLSSGYVKMADGTIIGTHIATSTGQFTIDINKAGQIFKIRVNP